MKNEKSEKWKKMQEKLKKNEKIKIPKKEKEMETVNELEFNGQRHIHGWIKYSFINENEAQVRNWKTRKNDQVEKIEKKNQQQIIKIQSRQRMTREYLIVRAQSFISLFFSIRDWPCDSYW